MNNTTRLKPGFTIIELLIASILFVFLAVSAISIFMYVMNMQRQINTQKKLQDETRYLIEKMVKEVRNGTIDYGFYYSERYPGDTYEDYENLPPDGTVEGYVGEIGDNGLVEELVIVHLDGTQRTRFIRETVEPTCDPDFEACEFNLVMTKEGYIDDDPADAIDPTWRPISWSFNMEENDFELTEAADATEAEDVLNSNRVTISDLRFIVSPQKDPFKFYDDISVQEHPMITIFLETEYQDDTLRTTPVSIQTSVSIRTYKHIPWEVIE